MLYVHYITHTHTHTHTHTLANPLPRYIKPNALPFIPGKSGISYGKLNMQPLVDKLRSADMVLSPFACD